VGVGDIVGIKITMKIVMMMIDIKILWVLGEEERDCIGGEEVGLRLRVL
jgi:hypothetical protein